LERINDETTLASNLQSSPFVHQRTDGFSDEFYHAADISIVGDRHQTIGHHLGMYLATSLGNQADISLISHP
jgi:hypothetical protein